MLIWLVKIFICDILKWILMVGMIIVRIEFVCVYVELGGVFWYKCVKSWFDYFKEVKVELNI